jgi:peptidoglycan-N-acetylglucosamine deacetylase
MADAIPASLFTSAATEPADHPQMAITFDDLPEHGPLPPGETREQVISKIVAALQLAGAPPTYGFVNGQWLEQHPADFAALHAWRAAGNPLGNHTWSHMNLNQHTLEEFEADASRNEPLLEKWMKDADWHWFRFPFLAEGDTPEKRAGVRAFLAQRGYKIAGVTMSFADYLWNEPYARCRAKGDSNAVTLLESSYLAAADENISYYRSMAHALFGHDIPYVLLMHVGALDAEMLPQLLELYRSHGFEFITLDAAERDSFYEQDVSLRLPPGSDSFEGLMAQRHLAVPPHPGPAVPFDTLCK